MDRNCLDEYKIALPPKLADLVELCVDKLNEIGFSITCEQLDFLLTECEDDPAILKQVIEQGTFQLILFNFRPAKQPVEDY